MRSTIHKQNSLITRYCLAGVVLVGLLGPLAETARGDFILQGDEQLTVDSYHAQGVLLDRSRVSIVSGGSVTRLKMYDSSTVNISAGSVSTLYANNSSTANISGGYVSYMYAIYAKNSSAVNISGGSVSGNLIAYDSSAVRISGGSLNSNLIAYDSSTVDISGGTVPYLDAYDSSVVTFYGRNFRALDGLVFDGDYVLGTGLLTGEWFDGTRWTVHIRENTPSATILVISDSEPKPVCVKYPAMDFNGDCKVDFSDLAVFLTHWLDCNLDPPSACWE